MEREKQSESRRAENEQPILANDQKDTLGRADTPKTLAIENVSPSHGNTGTAVKPLSEGNRIEETVFRNSS